MSCCMPGHKLVMLLDLSRLMEQIEWHFVCFYIGLTRTVQLIHLFSQIYHNSLSPHILKPRWRDCSRLTEVGGLQQLHCPLCDHHLRRHSAIYIYILTIFFLGDNMAETVPSKSTKFELAAVGLGEKRISFQKRMMIQKP